MYAHLRGLHNVDYRTQTDSEPARSLAKDSQSESARTSVTGICDPLSLIVAKRRSELRDWRGRHKAHLDVFVADPDLHHDLRPAIALSLSSPPGRVPALEACHLRRPEARVFAGVSDVFDVFTLAKRFGFFYGVQ